MRSNKITSNLSVSSKSLKLTNNYKAIVLTFIFIVPLLAGVLIINHISSPEIVSTSDAFHMQYFYQFSEGGHCYYPRSDIRFVSDGYTPLASKIFATVMGVFGTDIRWVRVVASLFGLGAMYLAGRCVYLISGNVFFAVLASMLSAGLEMKWYIDVGPNTIHVFFGILGLYFILRDRELSLRTVVLSSLALFACFWSKQTGLAYMLAGLLYFFVRDTNKAFLALAFMGLLSVFGVTYYSNMTDSDFLYWVFEMNQHQPIIWSRMWDVVLADIIFRKYSILVAIILAGLVCYVRCFRDLFTPEYIFLGATAFAGAYSSCKYGSGTTQMWLFYMMMVISGIAILAKLLEDKRLAPCLGGALLVMQGLSFVEDVRPYLINNDDKIRYRNIMTILSTPGASAYYINQGYLSLLAGQPAYSNAGEDCWHNGQFLREKLSPERKAWLERDPWDIVIINVPFEDGSFALYERLNQKYRPVSEIPRALKNADIYDIRYRKIIFHKNLNQDKRSGG